MFSCKLCNEKDRRIADLLAQIEMLRALVLPPKTSAPIPLFALEADKALSATDDRPSDPEELKRLSAIEAEREALLSGTYE